MKRLLILVSLIVFVSGCEIRAGFRHHAPPTGGVVVSTSIPAPNVVPSQSYVGDDYYDGYQDDCYGDCCWYYDYYDAYPYVEVCETMECFDPHSGYYEYAGQDCWYE